MVDDRADGAVPHGYFERRSDRVAVNAEVALRRSGALNYRVRVFDASPLGCMLEFVERPQLDERVWVKFEGLDAIEGVIAWSEGFRAGVQYARPMYPPVFDALVARLA